MHNFKFPLGAIIKDKEIFDEVVVVGRLLDADENNKPMYLVNRRGNITWYTAKALEDCFDIVVLHGDSSK
jgi:hypothetical protein